MENTKHDYAIKNGFKPLTITNHPKNGEIVEILGSSITNEIVIEKVQWKIDGNYHTYRWITEDFNRGIITFTLDYFRKI